MSNRQLSYETHEERETEEVGAGLASFLREGDVVCLHGDLGSGKTCLVRGILSGLHPGGGGSAKSPSYTVLNIYEGTPTVYHFDFYRVEDLLDLYALGLTDYWGTGICLVEWPKSFCYSLPGRKIDVIIAAIGDMDRKIEVTFGGID